MRLQTQEGPQAQADVVALGARGANLGTFDATELLNAAMVVFDSPGITGPAYPHRGTHLEVVAGPSLNVAVWGNDLEQAGQPVAF